MAMCQPEKRLLVDWRNKLIFACRTVRTLRLALRKMAAGLHLAAFYRTSNSGRRCVRN